MCVCGSTSHSLGRAAGRDEAAQRNGTDSRWSEEQFMWYRWLGLGKAFVEKGTGFCSIWSHVDIQSWTHMYDYVCIYTQTYIHKL